MITREQLERVAMERAIQQRAADDAEAELAARAERMSDEEVEHVLARLRPVENWAVLRLLVRGVTRGGVLIPASAAMAKRWQVARLGPGALIESGPDAGKRLPLPVQVGDVLLLAKGASLHVSDEYPRIAVMQVHAGSVIGVDERTDADLLAVVSQ